MSEDATTQAWLDAVLHEYDGLRGEMKYFVDNHRRDTKLLGGLLTALIGLYLSKPTGFDVSIAALIVPSAIFAYFLLQVCNLFMTSVEARACARIELKVHRKLGDWPMDWESRLAIRTVRGPGSPVAIATTVLMFALLVIFVGFAFVAYRNYGYLTVVLHFVELVLMGVTFAVWACYELRNPPPVAESDSEICEQHARQVSSEAALGASPAEPSA